jgi:hypothetical protein
MMITQGENEINEDIKVQIRVTAPEEFLSLEKKTKILSEHAIMQRKRSEYKPSSGLFSTSRNDLKKSRLSKQKSNTSKNFMKTQYIIPKFEVSELQVPFSPPKALNEQSEKEFKKIKQPRP